MKSEKRNNKTCKISFFNNVENEKPHRSVFAASTQLVERKRNKLTMSRANSFVTYNCFCALSSREDGKCRHKCCTRGPLASDVWALARDESRNHTNCIDSALHMHWYHTECGEFITLCSTFDQNRVSRSEHINRKSRIFCGFSPEWNPLLVSNCVRVF